MTANETGPVAAAATGPPLHSTTVGTAGPRVLCCHGLFGQGRNWTAVAKALSDRHRVTLVDLPDHGRSAWTERVSYADMALAVARLLEELAPGERWAVVGHSMGGKVAMALALLRPELVDRLCVVDIAPVSYGTLSSFADYVRGMRSLDLSRLTERATADRELQPYVSDPVVRGFLLQNLRRDGTGWRWQMNLALLGDRLADLGSWPDLGTDPYRGPTLWVAGAESSYVTPDHAPAMRALFPKVQLVTVKGAGHWVHSERPDVFVAALARFLAR
jgi:pimeloyl-ACP methyl ester carboxylesterase